jgi:hypothetical protein
MKYAVKDDDRHHDQGDQGDDAKYHEEWWSWLENRASGAGKNKVPPYYCTEEAHAG